MNEQPRAADVHGPVLLYDDTCGMCAQSVQFVLRHERGRRSLRFASLAGTTGSALRERSPGIRNVDSVVWLDDKSADGEVRTAAVIRVLRYLGGGWTILAALLAVVPRPIRDRLYDFVARHRHAFDRHGDVCLRPTPEQRARFVD